MSYAQQIQEFLVNNGLIEPELDIDGDESLLDQGIIDSIAIMELTEFISNTYNFRVNPMDLVPDNFKSLNAIDAFIGRHAVEQQVSPNRIGSN
jgi:acyl carrier protein